MGADEEKKIFIEEVQKKVNELSRTTQKKDWYKIYSLYFWGIMIFGGLIFVGTKLEKGYLIIQTWNGYGDAIVAEHRFILMHESSDSAIHANDIQTHKQMWAEIALHGKAFLSLLGHPIDQLDANRQRALYNDTIKVHSEN